MAITAPVSSGTTTLDGTEQTVYESAGYEPLSILLDFTLSVGANTTIIRTYGKALSAGSYVLVDATTVSGAPAEPGYKSIFFDFPYGLKWTLEMTGGTAFDVPWSVDKVV